MNWLGTQANRDKAAFEEPLLGHIHVPKCAGSSIRAMLDSALGASHIHLYFDHTTFVLDEDDLQRFVCARSARAFSSHFVRRFPKRLAQRPVHYVTFLRDPVKHFLSYLRYTRHHYSRIQDPVLRLHLPPDMDKLTVRECTAWIVNGDDRIFRNFRENYSTNFFARYVVLQERGYSYADQKYRRIRLRVAQKVLSSFLTVGITERLEDSWCLLRGACEGIGIHLPVMAPLRENVMKDSVEDLSWVNKRDKVGRALLRSVEEDRRLYSLFNRRLDQKLAELNAGRRRFPFSRLFSTS